VRQILTKLTAVMHFGAEMNNSGFGLNRSEFKVRSARNGTLSDEAYSSHVVHRA